MRITDMHFLRDHWYPVLPSDALGAAPEAVRLFGEDWALWRDTTGSRSRVATTRTFR